MHVVAGEPGTAGVGGEVGAGQFRVEQADQVAERFFLARVRGGGDEQQVPAGVPGDAGQQLVAELRRAGGGAGPVGGHAGVRLVDDDQVGAVIDEVVAVPGGLDEVGGDHHGLVRAEQRLAVGEGALKARDGRGEDELGVDAELGAQLVLPLLGEGGRAEHGESLRLALRAQFGGDEPGLDGLADAHVVADRQPDCFLAHGHQQWHQLVGPGFHGDSGQGPERSRAAPEPDAQCCPQQAGGLGVAEVVGVWRRERSLGDRFQVGEDCGDIAVGTAERAEDQHVRLAVRQHDPLPAACGDERPGRKPLRRNRVREFGHG